MDNTSKLFVFQMSVDSAQLFYQLCGEFKLDSVDERMALLTYLAKEGMVDRVYSTERTKEQWLADYRKHFNVLEAKGEANS